MSFSAELKDFTSGFQTGYKMVEGSKNRQHYKDLAGFKQSGMHSWKDYNELEKIGGAGNGGSSGGAGGEPGDPAKTSGGSGGGGGEQVQKDHEAAGKERYDLLVSLGAPPSVASGMVGNAYAESHFVTNASGDKSKEGGSHGEFQWDKSRYAAMKNWAAQNKMDPNDWQTQYRYAWHETQQLPGFNNLMKSENPTQAADWFVMNFEKPAGQQTGDITKVSQYQNRRNYSNKFSYGLPDNQQLGTTSFAGAGSKPGSAWAGDAGTQTAATPAASAAPTSALPVTTQPDTTPDDPNQPADDGLPLEDVSSNYAIPVDDWRKYAQPTSFAADGGPITQPGMRVFTQAVPTDPNGPAASTWTPRRVGSPSPAATTPNPSAGAQQRFRDSMAASKARLAATTAPAAAAAPAPLPTDQESYLAAARTYRAKQNAGLQKLEQGRQMNLSKDEISGGAHPGLGSYTNGQYAQPFMSYEQWVHNQKQWTPGGVNGIEYTPTAEMAANPNSAMNARHPGMMAAAPAGGTGAPGADPYAARRRQITAASGAYQGFAEGGPVRKKDEPQEAIPTGQFVKPQDYGRLNPGGAPINEATAPQWRLDAANGARKRIEERNKVYKTYEPKHTKSTKSTKTQTQETKSTKSTKTDEPPKDDYLDETEHPKIGDKPLDAVTGPAPGTPGAGKPGELGTAIPDEPRVWGPPGKGKPGEGPPPVPRVDAEDQSEPATDAYPGSDSPEIAMPPVLHPGLPGDRPTLNNPVNPSMEVAPAPDQEVAMPPVLHPGLPGSRPTLNNPVNPSMQVAPPATRPGLAMPPTVPPSTPPQSIGGPELAAATSARPTQAIPVAPGRPSALFNGMPVDAAPGTPTQQESADDPWIPANVPVPAQPQISEAWKLGVQLSLTDGPERAAAVQQFQKALQRARDAGVPRSTIAAYAEHFGVQLPAGAAKAFAAGGAVDDEPVDAPAPAPAPGPEALPVRPAPAGPAPANALPVSPEGQNQAPAGDVAERTSPGSALNVKPTVKGHKLPPEEHAPSVVPREQVNEVVKAGAKHIEASLSPARSTAIGADPAKTSATVDFASNKNAPTSAEYKQFAAHSDPEDKLPEHEQFTKTQSDLFDFYVSHGYPEKAAEMAGAMQMYGRTVSMKSGYMAQAAIEGGDLYQAGKWMAKAYAYSPDNKELRIDPDTVKDPENGQPSLHYQIVDNETGDVTEDSYATADEMLQMSKKMSSGTAGAEHHVDRCRHAVDWWQRQPLAQGSRRPEDRRRA